MAPKKSSTPKEVTPKTPAKRSAAASIEHLHEQVRRLNDDAVNADVDLAHIDYEASEQLFTLREVLPIGVESIKFAFSV
jgi:hypothetical protein